MTQYNLERITTIFKENIRNNFEVLNLIDREPWNEVKKVIKVDYKKGLPKLKKQQKMSEQIVRNFAKSKPRKI